MSGGARELTAGLGVAVSWGLTYIAQAGATRWPSGRRSTNTLWGQLNGNRGGRAALSTLRLTQASALREPLTLGSADDPSLNSQTSEQLASS